MRTDSVKKYVIPNIPYLFILWACLKLGTAYRLAPGADFAHKLMGLGQSIGPAFADFAPGLAPFDWLIGIVGAVGFRLLIYFKSKNAKKFRRDEEYGSARWGTEKDIKPFVDPKFENNVILTKTEFLTMNTRPKNPANTRNLNACIIGSSGSGKTRFWLTPQLLQAHSSYVCVDPKGGVLSQVGAFLQRRGYQVKVFNSIDFSKSMHYNPLSYIHNEADILKFVDTLIANTKGEGKEGDPFWTKAETLLYCALIAYIIFEAPAEDRNINTLVDMISGMDVKEDDESYMNAVDYMFKGLEKRKPDCFAAGGKACSLRRASSPHRTRFAGLRRGSTGGFGSAQLLSQHQSLLEQLQHALGHLIGLGQHGLGGLDQDVVLGVGHHLVGHVGVADGGLGVLDVLLHNAQVVDGVVQTVLGGAQSTADIRDIVDGALDLVQSSGSAGLIADLHIGEAQGGHVAVLDAYPQLVEAVGGIADLQGQGLAIIRLSRSSRCTKSSPSTGLISNTRASHSGALRSLQDIFVDTSLGTLGLCKQSLDILGTVLSSLFQRNSNGTICRDFCTICLISRNCGQLKCQILLRTIGIKNSISYNAHIHSCCSTITGVSNFSGGVGRHGAVQQLDAVKVGRVGDPVDFILELVDLLLELLAVGAVLKGAVGGLLGQLIHAVEHVVDLGQGAFGGLHQGDAVLGVVLGLVQAGDLGAHLLGDGEARGVVTGAVDLVAGGQLLQVLGQGGGVVGVVAVGVHRHDVMLDPHFDRFLSF